MCRSSHQTRTLHFYKDLGIVGKDFTLQAWKGVVAYELLQNACMKQDRMKKIKDLQMNYMKVICTSYITHLRINTNGGT